MFNFYNYKIELPISECLWINLVSFSLPQMRLQGVLGNTVGYISSESLAPSPAFSFYKQGELNSIDHNDLLFCFRRDSNKVKNYLRILKCTTLPEMDC